MSNSKWIFNDLSMFVNFFLTSYIDFPRGYIFSRKVMNHILRWKLHTVILGPCQAKKYHRICVKCADPDHPAHAQSIIRAFALHLYICSIRWFCLRTAKAQIKLRGRAVWSGPSLSAYARRHVFEWRGQLCLYLTEKFYADKTTFSAFYIGHFKFY